MRRLVFLAIAISFASSAQVQAQTAPAAPAAASLGGTVVPGVCLLSRQAVFGNAKVGQATMTRLRTIANEAQKEIDTDRAPIDADLQKYNAEQAKLSEAQRQERQKVLTERMKPVDAKANLRQREIEATRAKAMDRIAAAIEPVLAQVYKQHGCGLLVDRNSVLGGNMANDLTQAVVHGLDAKLADISFTREVIGS